MKTVLLVFTIVISNLMMAQTRYTYTLIDTFMLPLNEKATTKEETILAGQNPFIVKYDLADKKGIHAKTLYEVEIITEPAYTAKKTGIVIPKNEIVYLYKFFPENQYWAIEYDNNWGFVRDTLIFAISESSSDL